MKEIKWEDITQEKQVELIEKAKNYIVLNKMEKFDFYCKDQIKKLFSKSNVNCQYNYEDDIFNIYGSILFDDISNLINIKLSELEQSLFDFCLNDYKIKIDLFSNDYIIDNSKTYNKKTIEDYIKNIEEDSNLDINSFFNKMRIVEKELYNIFNRFCYKMTLDMEDIIIIPDDNECINYILNNNFYVNINDDKLKIVK